MLQADTRKLVGNSYWISTSGFNYYHYKENSPKEKATSQKSKATRPLYNCPHILCSSCVMLIFNDTFSKFR